VRAAVVSNGSLKIEERPDPSPGGDQVLVDVAAAGINRADLLQMRGLHPAPPGWPPDIPGLEFSGVVVETGPAARELKTGDPVFGIVGGGGHATRLIAPESLCVRLPADLDIIEAGGVPEVFITAHDALFTTAGLSSGERVLIHGVGSGVGTAAVQLVRAMGATSVGTARTPEKLERARFLGLDEAIEAGDDMVERIGEVDVVLDLVGGHYLETDVAVCRPRARIIIVGLLAGASSKLDMGAVMRKRLHIVGTVLRARAEYEKASATALFARSVVPLFERKQLRPVIDRTVDFDDIARGYKALESNETFGKVVVAMGG
jgi:putative PIG3 family NAD(P)H quinone oxidoreductase